jgi:hypothetical protein
LRDGKQLTRAAMYQAMESANISTAGQRGIHLLWRAAHDGLICFGAREGKQQTFALLEEWAPQARRMTRDESLAEVARRYFTAHGPATVQDFTWWTGLAAAEAKAALEVVKSELLREQIGDQTYWLSQRSLPAQQRRLARPARAAPGAHLLPAFDEYLVGYRDRSAVLDLGEASHAVNAGGGMLAPTMVIDGRVVGTWRRTLKKGRVAIAMSPFTSLSKAEQQSLAVPAERYSKFLGVSLQEYEV